MNPSPYNEYQCPECDESVRVELPAPLQVRCDCGVLLNVDADAEQDENGWHDRTTLSVAPERPAYDGEDAEAWQRESAQAGS